MLCQWNHRLDNKGPLWFLQRIGLLSYAGLSILLTCIPVWYTLWLWVFVGLTATEPV